MGGTIIAFLRDAPRRVATLRDASRRFATRQGPPLYFTLCTIGLSRRSATLRDAPRRANYRATHLGRAEKFFNLKNFSENFFKIFLKNFSKLLEVEKFFKTLFWVFGDFRDFQDFRGTSGKF